MKLVINPVLKTALLISGNYLPENVFLERMGKIKSSEEITKLKESTSAHKSFAEMGGPELTT